MDPDSAPAVQRKNMNNLNSVLVEGNLTHDPEVVTLKDGTMLTRFSIGVNRSFMNNQKQYISEVSFFVVVTWGKTAENCAKFLTKGRGIRVLGRLRQEKWKTESDESRERVVIVAEHVEFQPEKKSDDSRMSENKTAVPIDIDPAIEIPDPDEEMDEIDVFQPEIHEKDGKKAKS